MANLILSNSMMTNTNAYENGLCVICNGDGEADVYYSTEDGLPIPGYYYCRIRREERGSYSVSNDDYILINKSPIDALNLFVKKLTRGILIDEPKIRFAVRVLSTVDGKYAVTLAKYDTHQIITTYAKIVKNEGKTGYVLDVPDGFVHRSFESQKGFDLEIVPVIL